MLEISLWKVTLCGSWYLKSVTKASHVQVLTWQRKKTTFIERTGSLEDISEQAVHIFLLAETLGKEYFFFLFSSDIITVCENYLSWFPNSNWGFCLLIFFTHSTLLNSWLRHSCNKKSDYQEKEKQKFNSL